MQMIAQKFGSFEEIKDEEYLCLAKMPSGRKIDVIPELPRCFEKVFGLG